MDRNFLFAILLSTLVIILYSSPWYQNRFGHDMPAGGTETAAPETPLTTARPSTPSTLEQAEEGIDTTDTDSAGQDTTAVDTTVFRQVEAPSKPVTFSMFNDDIELVFSSLGGELIKAYMQNYQGASGDEKAQLVHEGEAWLAGGIVDGDRELRFDDVVFAVTAHDKRHVTLDAVFTNGATLTREYTLDETGFMLHVATSCRGAWDDPSAVHAWHGPLNQTEKPSRMLDIFPFNMFSRDDDTYYSKVVYLGQGDRTTVDHKGKEKSKRIYAKEGTQKLEIKKDRPFSDIFVGDLEWQAVRNKYFMSAVIPREKTLWTTTAAGTMYGEMPWFDFTASKRLSDGDTTVDVYIGPIQYDTLKSYGHDLTRIMELSWAFIRPLSIGFLWLIKKIHTVLPNWGLVIILFSIIIKVVLYPLSKSSIESMRKMSSLQPQINEIREKFKNNPNRQHQEIMALYKTEKVNPFGGCLPILLQMPVFFALYPVIGRAFELRQAMFIPGWIEDLSRPDPFFILPIAMGVSTFFQSKSTMKDPNQKAMLYTMPIFLVVLFVNFSSGLTLYWFLFNLMTLVQQKFHGQTA